MSSDSIRCAKCAGTGRVTPTNGRTGLKETCTWGWKYTKNGAVLNRRHVCSEVCSWTSDECFAWLETQSHLDYTGWASCLCGLSARQHVRPAAKDDGSLAGYRFVDCEYQHREPVAPELVA